MDATTANDRLLANLAARNAQPRERWAIARHSAKWLAKGGCERKALRLRVIGEWLPRVECPDCGRPMSRVDFVNGTYSEGRECNDRCMGATGPSCECRCAGENHGAAHGG